MPDLTDAELEAMERRADNGNQQRIDIYALIAALREARAENIALFEGNATAMHGLELQHSVKRNALLAENRLLQAMYCGDTCFCRQRSDTELASKAPLTAAEVERVQILELAAKILDGCHEWLIALLQSEAHAIVRDTCPEGLRLVDVATVLVALAKEEKNIE